jgi:UPF0755 protein
MSKRHLNISLIILIIILVALAFFSRSLWRLVRRPTPSPVIYQAEETIKILEGWTNQDIADYFAARGKWTSAEFLEQSGQGRLSDRSYPSQAPGLDFSAEFSFLEDKPAAASLEGYLFPDTYRIYASTTIDAVLRRMLENFETKLTPALRAEIKKQDRTIYEVLILASIVEKEAPIHNAQSDNYDARVVAGIFLDRLKIGQALQSDATLSYIFRDDNPQHSGADLVIDSPYNTYKYRGLPPGPICNPGQLAINAAIYPLYTEYNYFLTPTDTREVIYARTYAEHLANKKKYLQ